ncbi:MAG: [FeFe] hydrogenase H-cluster radical SAM maturase HydE [Oscillospiraceae bacterium]|nr:[FeFe] hydrogenase H-cluster radical SAM maturase HydE [Oscillospiraceae bacterium]
MSSMKNLNNIITELKLQKNLLREDFKLLLTANGEEQKSLHKTARETSQEVFSNKIYMRGLIEFTNYCKNDCYYCGIRKSNAEASRYRMTKAEILERCKSGYELGFRTFVLQGGEDPYYTDEMLCDIVKSIKCDYSDCAITLSLGERSYESLKLLRVAGADRYLLRQETSNAEHYLSLHPQSPNSMTLASRQKCLFALKELGYQLGCGFMVGSPNQTLDHIIDDFAFIKELDPAMVGIGPFIPHSKTPFANELQGGLGLTLNALAILRLMKPNLLLPATTALGTIDSSGREMGVLAGANVVMPNLSPPKFREKYLLYDNKICVGDGPSRCSNCIRGRMKKIGYEIVESRGDYVEI